MDYVHGGKDWWTKVEGAQMIPVLELVRLEEDFKYGTFGVLKINKQLFCMTLEPRDEENAQNISSIPAQQYIAERYNSPTYGEVFRVNNVPGRSAILFHWGNYQRNTEGCILLGDRLLGGPRGVGNSRIAFQRFMDALSGYKKANLTIREVY